MRIYWGIFLLPKVSVLVPSTDNVFVCFFVHLLSDVGGSVHRLLWVKVIKNGGERFIA